MHLHYGWWVHGRSETEQRRMNLVNIFLQCFLVKLYCLSLLLLLVFFFCFLGFFGWRRQHNGSLMLWYSLALWLAANATDALESYTNIVLYIRVHCGWFMHAKVAGDWSCVDGRTGFGQLAIFACHTPCAIWFCSMHLWNNVIHFPPFRHIIHFILTSNNMFVGENFVFFRKHSNRVKTSNLMMLYENAKNYRFFFLLSFCSTNFNKEKWPLALSALIISIHYSRSYTALHNI